MKQELPTNIFDKWRWAAADPNGEWIVYIFKPRFALGRWENTDEWHVLSSQIFSNLPTDIPWKDSLHERQEDGSWKKPLPNLEVDTRVLVRDSRSECWRNRYFSHFDNKRKICCFSLGRTSWSTTTVDDIINWNHWKLPDGEEQ